MKEKESTTPSPQGEIDPERRGIIDELKRKKRGDYTRKLDELKKGRQTDMRL